MADWNARANQSTAHRIYHHKIERGFLLLIYNHPPLDDKFIFANLPKTVSRLKDIPSGKIRSAFVSLESTKDRNFGQCPLSSLNFLKMPRKDSSEVVAESARRVVLSSEVPPIIPPASTPDIESTLPQTSSSWSDDPHNPLNWPSWRKAMQALMLSSMAFTTFVFRRFTIHIIEKLTSKFEIALSALLLCRQPE